MVGSLRSAQHRRSGRTRRPPTGLEEVTMSVQKLAKLAVRVALVGGAGLALVTPSADARPVTDVPMHAAAPARQAVPLPSVQRHAPARVPARQSRELMRDDLIPAGGDVAASRTPAHHTSAVT